MESLETNNEVIELENPIISSQVSSDFIHQMVVYDNVEK